MANNNDCDKESIHDYHGGHDTYTFSNKTEILKKAEILKKHPKYKIMQQKNEPLSDCELIAMICCTDFTIYCRNMKESHRGLINVRQWQELYYHATNAIIKMHRVFHYKNNNTPHPKRLYHGSEICSLDPLSQEQLFLKTFWSFTTKFSIAKSFSTGSIWIIDNVDEKLRSGILKGADISWISKYNELEIVILPTILYNLRQMTKIEIMHNHYEISDNIKIYIASKYISNINPLEAVCDTMLPKMKPNYIELQTQNEYKNIKDWFDNELGLTENDSVKYFDLFIKNGYNTFELIEDIVCSQDLKDIGIVKIAHVKRILKKIKSLQNYLDEQQENNAEISQESNDEYKVQQQPNTQQIIPNEIYSFIPLVRRKKRGCQCDWVHHDTIPINQFAGAPITKNERKHIAAFHPDLHRRLLNKEIEEDAMSTFADDIFPHTQQEIGNFIQNELNKSLFCEKTNEINTKEMNLTYVGKKEDDVWWDNVKPDDTKIDEKQEDEIYRGLVEKMGVFRWQNPHGFEAGQNGEIIHSKPKFKNIKDEVLLNDYQPLTKDNWNQTLRKSEIFCNSWARQRIRTKSKGYYDDRVTGHKEEWEDGKSIDMKGIITLKLYTDFDVLQRELKKCFRFETFDRILHETDYMTAEQIMVAKDKSKTAKEELKKRLENFYHWRSKLLIVLSKFGAGLNEENNMIIRPNQTYAFNGPLSTTSSYHVARTFATTKGMILKITSHFPRLNFCNAFDASLVSDYPEEQEWLVGFMYVRLLKVRTRKLVDYVVSFDDLLQKMNLSSLTREVFFAIHLFKEQIFPMSEHLEKIQAQFLKVNRKECCDPAVMEEYKEQYKQFQDSSFQILCHRLCRLAGHQTAGNLEMESKYATKEDPARKISPMIWKKFNEFRMNPNLKQRIKLDTISDHLKRFFMEEIEEKYIETGENKWEISFGLINSVYPNVKEIHFINQYRFDDKLLHKLIKQIEKNGNTIKNVIFLYYNYKKSDKNDENKPLNHKIFKDPDHLNKDLTGKLENKRWTIKHCKNGNAGIK